VAELPGIIRGGAWGADDTIVVGGRQNGLVRVPAAGGTPQRLTAPDEGRQLWYPQVLPGGRAVLFTSSEQRPDSGELQILTLETGERRTVLPGSAGRLLPSGHLVFVRGGSLWAAAFDLNALNVIDNPVPVLEGVRVEPGGAVQLAVADDGTLAYLPGDSPGFRRLFWVDRQGKEEALDAPPRRYLHPRLSPSGDRIALDVRDAEDDIWIWHIARKTLTRLTFDQALDQHPTWTPDGRQVIFASSREKVAAPYQQAADGTGAAERLGSDPRPLDLPILHPDGKRLVLHAVSPETGEDIVVMSLDGNRRIEPLLSTRFTERNAALSPNGAWIAYQSNESGIPEVYVRPFPNVNAGRWQVSTGGGTRPVWSRNGRELLYLAENGTLMGVPVDAGAAFTFGAAAAVANLSEAPSDLYRYYDVSPDGHRFLIAKDDSQEGTAQIDVILNWLEELKRLVPTN
jgi:serine/threonine-protein kinase